MTKEKSHLITQNLINSTKWALNAPDSIIKEEKGGNGKLTWRQKAMDDLSNTVNRVPGDFPEAAKQGVEFEKKVYLIANNDTLVGSPQFQKVCKEVKGFRFYEKGGVNAVIEGKDCYLYAKYDAIDYEKEIVKDIKTTGNFSNENKYLNSIQHKLYCYISGLPHFQYIIAEWEVYPKIKDVHIIQYNVTDEELLKLEIEREIIECFEVLKDFGLWEAYREKYCLY